MPREENPGISHTLGVGLICSPESSQPNGMELNRGLADLIRSHRPAGARAYFLRNTNGRFPMTGGFSLEPFRPPTCPAGSYSLGFLEDVASNEPLLPAVVGFGYPVIPVPAMDASGTEATALVKQEVQQQKQIDPLTNHPAHIENRVDAHRNRVDAERVRLADEGVRSQLLMTDLGQTLLYAQAWRQEAQRSLQSQAEIAAIERDRLTRARALADAENQRLSKILQDERTQRPQPPPDHYATSLAFLGQLANLAGVAISPAIAKQQGGKQDAVLDALIGAADTPRPPSAEMVATKLELETAKAELAAKQAAKSNDSENSAIQQALALLQRLDERLTKIEQESKNKTTPTTESGTESTPNTPEISKEKRPSEDRQTDGRKRAEKSKTKTSPPDQKTPPTQLAGKVKRNLAKKAKR